MKPVNKQFLSAQNDSFRQYGKPKEKTFIRIQRKKFKIQAKGRIRIAPKQREEVRTMKNLQKKSLHYIQSTKD